MRCAYCNGKTDQEFCSDDCQIHKNAFDEMLKAEQKGVKWILTKTGYQRARGE
jgi:hypothetical protein